MLQLLRYSDLMLSALHPEQSAALEAWERKASVELPARLFRELAGRSALQ